MGGFPFFTQESVSKCFWKCFKAGNKSAWVLLLPSLPAVSPDLLGARLWAPGGAPAEDTRAQVFAPERSRPSSSLGLMRCGPHRSEASVATR